VGVSTLVSALLEVHVSTLVLTFLELSASALVLPLFEVGVSTLVSALFEVSVSTQLPASFAEDLRLSALSLPFSRLWCLLQNSAILRQASRSCSSGTVNTSRM
jgi:hypothetical protein